MTSVKLLHETIRRSINSIDTAIGKRVSAQEVDTYINKAKDYILQNYSILAESSAVYEDHLRELEEVDVKLTVLNDGSEKTIVKLPDNYYKFLKVRVFAEAECYGTTCKDEITNMIYFQRDDVSLNDPNYEPSWEWRRGLYNLTKNTIYLYHNSKYKISNVYLDYIKFIPNVAAPSYVPTKKYTTADGILYEEDVDLELSSTVLWRKICEIAEFYIKKDKLDNYQATLESIIFNETSAIRN